MAKFITSNELNAEIEKLFETAKEQLILISPFVKLHPRYASALLTQLANPKLNITIVFGKNVSDPGKSIDPVDLEFFKQFPYVEIRYEKRLHAKYYANESAAIITSMNLYSYSQDNNIESGVLMTTPIIRTFSDSLDDQAWAYFSRVIDQSWPIYRKIPEFEPGFMGLTKKYTGSTVVSDNIDSFFKRENKQQIDERIGYCIVTGAKIPFNILQPLSREAYKEWAKHKDYHLKGNYCHFSGEQGNSTFTKPVLPKNWKKAQDLERK